MKIAAGADHAGFELKEKLKQYLAQRGIEVRDYGTFSPDSVDYPAYARLVGEAVVSGEADCGILFCGTGIGMSIAANKVHGVRAAHVTSEFEGRICREHNNANVIALGGRVLTFENAIKIVDAWLGATFSAGRHQERLNQIAEIETAETEQEDKRLV